MQNKTIMHTDYTYTAVVGDVKLAANCMLCGESIKLTQQEQEYVRYFGQPYRNMVCDECKRAVAWAREHMEGDNGK